VLAYTPTIAGTQCSYLCRDWPGWLATYRDGSAVYQWWANPNHDL